MSKAGKDCVVDASFSYNIGQREK